MDITRSDYRRQIVQVTDNIEMKLIFSCQFTELHWPLERSDIQKCRLVVMVAP